MNWIDPTWDPCAEYKDLREVLKQVARGETVRRVRFKNGEEERETDFSAANIEELRKLMREAHEACAAQTNPRGRRRAIGIGVSGRTRLG